MQNANKYIEPILTSLIKKYRGSRKELTGNGRSLSIKPSSVLRDYEDPFCNIIELKKFNEAAKFCESSDFVSIDWGNGKKEKAGLKIKRIILNEDKVEETEAYLSSEYGCEAVPIIRDRTQRLIDDYNGKTKGTSYICDKLAEMLEKGKVPKNVEICKELLETVAYIENNDEPLYPRELSIILFGDSKYLKESGILKWAERVLHRSGDETLRPGEKEDDVLERYNISQRGEMLCIKGKGRITLPEGYIDLSVFPHGLQFSSKDFENIQSISILTGTFMTIENYTSWLRFENPDITTFYLGGYANRAQLRFLRKVYEDNKELSYLHFGDIDPYGFYIFDDLCRESDIPFKTYMMTKDVLQDERYKKALKPLTSTDTAYLKKLAEIPEYHDMAEYMLKTNVKIEQEIVSYHI